MTQPDVIVVHEFDGTKYFEALVKLYHDGKIKRLRFVESSVFKKFIRDLVLEKKPISLALKRAVTNAIFRIQVPFIRGKVVIVGMPPWDFRMVWYGLLAHNNRFVYHTSWPYWELDTVPRRYGLLSRFFRAAWDKVLRTPSVQLVSISSASAEGVRQIYPETSIRVIPHVVSDEFFEADPPTITQQFGILYIGELSQKKGIELIPKVLNQVSDLTIQMSIVGDGPLRNFVDQLNSCPNVTIHGRVTDRKVLAQICTHHHVLLVPSLKTKKWQELFGIVIIEAMAVGLPVIASDHVGPRSIIHHEHNGFLVPEGAINDYARSIRLLTQESEQWGKMSTNARISARDYTLSSITAQWSELLQDTAKENLHEDPVLRPEW